MKLNEHTVFISTEEAADEWGVKPRTVAKWCKDGKIISCFKDKGSWKLHPNSIKPLSDQAIRSTILSLLKIHNHMVYGYDEEILVDEDERQKLNSLLRYLDTFGYIECKNDKNPTLKEVLFTDKAYEALTHKFNFNISIEPVTLIKVVLGALPFLIRPY